jgi:hypothetical protein
MESRLTSNARITAPADLKWRGRQKEVATNLGSE